MRLPFIVLLGAMLLLACNPATTTPTISPPTEITDTPVPTRPTSFYVDGANGSDSNPGTQTQPWQTIQKAADSALPGDTVTVLAGTYNERVQVTTSGLSGAPITYQAQGTVTMQGFTVQADDITIKGFDITDTPDDDQDGIGIFVQGSYCDLEDNYIYYATRGGILLFAEPGDDARTSHCTVRNNRLYRDSQNGIDVRGMDNLVEGNEIWKTIQYHPNWANPPSWVDADGIRFFGSGHIFRKNYIHDIDYSDPLNVNPHIDCFQTFADAHHEAASDIVIEQNRCENDTLAHSTDEGGVGLTIQDGAGDIIIRNNIVDAFVNIYLANSSGVSILNNTLVGNTEQNLDFNPVGIGVSKSTETVIENNIFYNQPGNIIYVNGNKPHSGQNMIYRDDGHPIYTTDTYNPAHDLLGIDPLFVNPQAGDYHLQAGSPAIDAGSDLRGLVPDDFEGTSRPQGAGYDIGAYEYTPLIPQLP